MCGTATLPTCLNVPDTHAQLLKSAATGKHKGEAQTRWYNEDEDDTPSNLAFVDAEKEGREQTRPGG